MIRFYAATLGCKINQYETRAIAEAWARNAGAPAAESGDPRAADLILVNSCAVTANAVADLRQAVRKLHRDNPSAPIIVTGCAAQVMPDELAGLPGVVRVVPQADKAALLAGPGGEPLPEPAPFPPFAITGYDRARPVVKVQDGCSHHCTYCIVPLTRGRSVSREPGEVAAEVRRLLDGGWRELILSGINLRHYGRGLAEKTDFWDLVARLEREFAPEWSGRARLRLSSVEPGQLDAKGFDTLAASVLVCPQLHLSLQSGDPDVLRAMGRGHYRPETAVEFLDRLREPWPVFGLGADFICGFPGETPEQFENTLTLARRLPLTYAHVFPYSERPGTPAADMPNQVDPAERKARAARLRKLVAGRKRVFLDRLLGTGRLDVLVQDARGEGVSQYYAACRFGAPLPGDPVRALIPARPVAVERGVILVEPLDAKGEASL
ncbi:MiaB/RimO family radical SAM methylthiotransferase [Pseudodesulfovibrio sp.]|uniref:MiaB/RimO family radical SAM methylthiotransferase n=1 Tax=Pseudodesulfovibrio sp. TaxID=2035812 RepID=UPI0026390570|nr:MiaB/RimO family radical SAM methylthiotransferase [Pseudodesulfovibrio sp.]MDD3313728.1 MiaB/RimO family radical SAM methylthiotransferase [Pseudodesulfovibrio sp.]